MWEHTAPLARATGQAGGAELGSGFLDACPHGDRLTGSQRWAGRRKMLDPPALMEEAWSLPSLISLSDGGDRTLFLRSQRPAWKPVLMSRKPCPDGD